jgi:hypothetical protein
MATNSRKTEIDVSVRVHLRESETSTVPEKLPEVVVHAFDENGEYLASATFDAREKAVLKATVRLPTHLKNKTVRLAMGVQATDLYEGVPPWMKALLLEQPSSAMGGETPDKASRSAAGSSDNVTSAPTLASLIRGGAREMRVRVTEAVKFHEVFLYPGEWSKWLKCNCEVRGRLIRRVPLPDGTSRDVGICHACVQIYEVDSFPRLIARLPELDLIRIRDDLWRLKEILRLPPWERPTTVMPPRAPEPPEPFTMAFSEMPAVIASRTGIAALGPQPEPPDTPVGLTAQPLPLGIEGELETVFRAGSSAELRNALIGAAERLVPYLCYIPWLVAWYKKDLIKCVCTGEDGQFRTTIQYPCFGDKPDLYFRAVQCIGGDLHVLYDPGVACHTHWNYVCGTEVILETNDPAARVCVPADPVRPPSGTTPWIMPYGIGGFRLDQIDAATGLVDYIAGGVAIEDAPFGATLGFRSGHSNIFPAPGMTHYRWLYKKEGTSTWREFVEPVAAPVLRHFVDEDLSDPLAPPTFPAYTLGPKSIGGKHLYEFRPVEPPQIPGHNRYWPTDNWFNEIYSGILRSTALPGGIDAAAGKYKIKLEIYDDSGNRVAPGPGKFRFIVPTGLDADGITILTRNATASELEDDGFVFFVHVDNRSCSALIPAPTANGNPADDNCGFLRFDPGDPIAIQYRATHPANFAYFHFWIRRGIQVVSNVAGEVTALSVTSSAGPAHSYAGDGSGNFAKTNFTTGQLLGTCSQAAFAEVLRTRAKATDGWNRLSGYDAGTERAFALAPKPT